MKMTRDQQILKASLLGTAAYNNGVQCSPCLDPKLMNMLKNRSIGYTPNSEASSINIMDAWTTSWTAANLTLKFYPNRTI